jgi:hypothetical protein
MCRAKIFAVIQLPDLGVRQRLGMLVDEERSPLAITAGEGFLQIDCCSGIPPYPEDPSSRNKLDKFDND